MANWTADVYDTLADAETAIETIDNTDGIRITAFKEGAYQKVLVTKGGAVSGAASKSVAVVDAWAAVAQNAIREGAIVDLESDQNAILHIDCALTAAVSHTGTEIIVQVSSSATDDEFWSNLTPVIGPLGTPNTENITNDPLAAGSTTITCASTIGYTTKAEWRFIKDVTIANSELIMQTDVSANVNISILDGTKRAHVLNTPMWSIADTLLVQLPAEARRARVIYNNTYDSDGASIATRCRAVTISGL